MNQMKQWTRDFKRLSNKNVSLYQALGALVLVVHYIIKAFGHKSVTSWLIGFEALTEGKRNDS